MKNKKGLIIFVVLLLLIAAGAFSLGLLKNKPKKAATEETKEEETTNKPFSYMPVTYKVCDEDSCIHIVGSYHLGDKRIRKVDQKLLDIFDSSDYLALEIKDEDTVSIASYMYKDGTTIEDRLSPELYAKLNQFSEDHPKYKLDAYKYYTLGFNSALLELIPFQEEYNTVTQGIDDLFHKRAVAQNKEVLAFETAEFQLNLLVGYSDAFYAKQIEYFVDHYEEIYRMELDLLEAYLKADVDEMNMILDAEAESSKEPTQEEIDYANAMYTNRNNNMTAIIKTYLAENKNVFVVVGEAHVITDDGIIAQLKETNNYKITRVE